MKPFKTGGYYAVLDRTAFFSEGYVLEVEEGGRLPTGTILKFKKGPFKSTVAAITSSGHELIVDLSHRNKFKPATNKQISQYKKSGGITMNELIEKVEQWAIDRNLHTADSKGQALKVVEEFTETLIEIDKKPMSPDIQDGIGDTYVTLIILCQQIKADFKDLRKQAKESAEGRVFSLLDPQQYPLNHLATGAAKGNVELMQYGVLGILYTLDLMINRYDVTDEECLSVAYNEIKDRKGRMVDGVFVKESDL